MKKISICVPVYNEEDNIVDMYKALCETMDSIGKYEYEILFADNASTDNSQNILRDLASQDKSVKVTINNKNFGPGRSGMNNIMKSTGDAVIVIPCDFQEPVELIPVFLSEWEKGNLVVWGQKTKSKENKLMYRVRAIYYFVLRKMSNSQQYKQVTGFGLYDRKVVEDVRKYFDNFRGMKLCVAEFGYNVKLIPYEQQVRRKGVSSYNTKRYFDLAFNMILQSSDKIFRMIFKIGVATMLLSALAIICYCIYDLVNKYSINLNTILLLLIIQLLGFMVLAVSILGENIKLLLQRSMKNPLVIEKESINFDK